MRILISAALLALAAPAVAASYMPTGPQLNVNIATVTGGGWTLCYSALMATPFGEQASVTLANCSGSRVMLAGRETGSDTLLVLSQTVWADAFADTGADDNNVFTNSNGSDWFYSDNWSWGFKLPGHSFTKFQCDYFAQTPSMCVHTLASAGGFSINDITYLNDSTDYEKLVFVASDIPEPATWALLIAGFGLVGASLRHRRTVAA